MEKLNLYERMNHYEANSEFRLLYSRIQDHFIALEAFLKHIHEFVSFAENKIGEDLEIYSTDFFEYYYAGSYGETFRSSFIVTVTSVSEVYIKDYIHAWEAVSGTEILVKHINGILDYLKEADKSVLNTGIDFSKKEVVDFKGLLAIRNAIVHSSGSMDYASKYEPLIRQITKAYPSIQLSTEGVIWTEEQFCRDSLNISKRLFFYLFRLAIRKFPNYLIDKPQEDNFS